MGNSLIEDDDEPVRRDRGLSRPVETRFTRAGQELTGRTR